MTTDYKPGDRIRATIEGEIDTTYPKGVWVVFDETTYGPGWDDLRAYIPYAAITEKIEPPAPAWIEGDIVYGAGTGRLYERTGFGWEFPGVLSPVTDDNMSADLARGLVRAIVRGGEIVR